MLKFNKNQSNNVRDINLSYIVGGVIYIIIGVMGGLGVIGRKDSIDQNIVLDFFKTTDIVTLLVEVIYLMHLVSLYPIFCTLTKQRVFESLGVQASTKMDIGINIVFVIICAVIKNIPQVKPDTITNLNGAFCCFFIVYLIPISNLFEMTDTGAPFSSMPILPPPQKQAQE